MRYLITHVDKLNGRFYPKYKTIFGTWKMFPKTPENGFEEKFLAIHHINNIRSRRV